MILPRARLEECPAIGCICHEAEEDLPRKPPVDAFLKAEKATTFNKQRKRFIPFVAVEMTVMRGGLWPGKKGRVSPRVMWDSSNWQRH